MQSKERNLKHFKKFPSAHFMLYSSVLFPTIKMFRDRGKCLFQVCRQQLHLSLYFTVFFFIPYFKLDMIKLDKTGDFNYN